jgi:hypothetical protein
MERRLESSFARYEKHPLLADCRSTAFANYLHNLGIDPACHLYPFHRFAYTNGRVAVESAHILERLVRSGLPLREGRCNLADCRDLLAQLDQGRQAIVRCSYSHVLRKFKIIDARIAGDLPMYLHVHAYGRNSKGLPVFLTSDLQFKRMPLDYLSAGGDSDFKTFHVENPPAVLEALSDDAADPEWSIDSYYRMFDDMAADMDREAGPRNAARWLRNIDKIMSSRVWYSEYLSRHGRPDAAPAIDGLIATAETMKQMHSEVARISLKKDPNDRRAFLAALSERRSLVTTHELHVQTWLQKRDGGL